MTATRLGWVALSVAVLALGWNAATRSVDFPLYREAGEHVLQGQFELYPAGLYTGDPVPSHGYRYAPGLAFLFTPFALVPLEVAAFLFFLLKVAMLIGLTGLLANHLHSPSSTVRVGVLAVLVTGGYLVEEFRYGNLHFLMVVLVTWATVATARGQVVGPAAALTIAIGAKLTPVAVLGYWLVRRRFAACIATVVALGVLAWLPTTIVGWKTNAHLLDGFARYAVQKAEEGRNHSLRGAIIKHLTTQLDESAYPGVQIAALGPVATDGVWLGCVLLASIATLGALWKGALVDETDARTNRTRLLELSLVVTAMLLLSPHTQRQYLVSLFVPVFVLLDVARLDHNGLNRRLARLAIAAVGTAGTVLPLVFGGRRLALAYEGWSPHLVATLVVFVVLLVLLTRLRVPRHPATT